MADNSVDDLLIVVGLGAVHLVALTDERDCGGVDQVWLLVWVLLDEVGVGRSGAAHATLGRR